MSQIEASTTFLSTLLSVLTVILVGVIPVILIAIIIMIFCGAFSKIANYLVKTADSISKAIVSFANGLRALESKKSKIILPIVTAVYIACVITYLVLR